MDLWLLNRQNFSIGIGGISYSADYAACFKIQSSADGQIWTYRGPFGSFRSENIPGIDVVIGMDIIQEGRLVIEKVDGMLILAFTIENDIEKR